MATTLKYCADRAREQRLVDAVMCLDCDSPRGTACTDLRGQPQWRCCRARFDFGWPIVQAEVYAQIAIDAMAGGEVEGA